PDKMIPKVRTLIVALAALAAFPAAAQVAAPDNWRKESFDFPLRFAPSIPYEGKEYVRFSPQWAHFEDGDGFTYVFLWDLKTKAFNADDLEDYMETYFSGLMNNVGRQRNLADKEIKSSAAANPLLAVPGWTQSWGIEVRTWNAFSKGEPLLLRGEVTQRDCGPRMQVFFAVSMAPRDKAAWNALRDARKATTCPPPASP
ncbi:MAG TPA: hypothetical protein VGI57_05330, partial [Usitatibacter sp.]